jgi:hypothetical protein
VWSSSQTELRLGLGKKPTREVQAVGTNAPSTRSPRLFYQPRSQESTSACKTAVAKPGAGAGAGAGWFD